MNGYEKEVKEKLKVFGWQFLRSGKGTHEVWTDGTHSVTVNKDCRSRHTANSIMKAAGIDHKF